MRIAWSGLAALFLALFAWSFQQPAESAQAAPSGKVVTVDVALQDFKLDPANWGVTAGDTVVFNMKNTGRAPHNLHIGGQGVDVQSPTFRAGESGTWSFTFPRAGLYAIYCDIGAGRPTHHRLRGMEGTVNVGASSDAAPLQTRNVKLTPMGGSKVGGSVVIQPRADGATAVTVEATGLTAGTSYFSGAYSAASNNCAGGLIPPFADSQAATSATATMAYIVNGPASSIQAVSVREGTTPPNAQQVRACADTRLAAAGPAPSALPRTGDDATPLAALLSALAAVALGSGFALRRFSAQ